MGKTAWAERHGNGGMREAQRLIKISQKKRLIKSQNMLEWLYALRGVER